MRLDQMLVDRGLVATRSRARDLIVRGFVRVGGKVCDKPARKVSGETAIEFAAGAPDLVSRAGEKLRAALAHFGFDAKNCVALDIGASTGGFTQVLLQRGARRIYAVDVGTGQLHPDVKSDPRVVALEQFDARRLDGEIIPQRVDAIVADVSFISLAKVLPAALELAAPHAWLVALIKPQFEVGRQAVGKGGIVRDAAARQRAVAGIEAFMKAQPGWTVLGTSLSPIIGGSGNEEYLIGARRDG